MNRTVSKDLFLQRRSSYDQGFKCEDDLPRSKRRLRLTYNPGAMSRGLVQCQRPPGTRQTGQAEADTARASKVPNTFRGQFVLEQVRPAIVRQLVAKPAAFRPRVYLPPADKVHELYSTPMPPVDKFKKHKGMQPSSAWRHQSLQAGEKSPRSPGGDPRDPEMEALFDSLHFQFDLNPFDAKTVREERKLQQMK